MGKAAVKVMSNGRFNELSLCSRGKQQSYSCLLSMCMLCGCTHPTLLLASWS
jgi:hypothetical protein